MAEIGFIDPEEMKIRVALSNDASQPNAVDDATELMVVYTDCLKGHTIQEAYDEFRQALEIRWKHPVTFHTAYAVLEAITTLTQSLKKTHISGVNFPYLASTPPASQTKK